MIGEWLGTTWPQLGLVAISTVSIFAAVIVYARIAGLRSFAKMSSSDFAMTVAVGSLIAGTAASSSTTLIDGLVALAVLFASQVALALIRRRFRLGSKIDNTPRVLMAGTEYLDENMAHTRVTRSEVRSKLRDANVVDFSQLHAVVLEATGDISVLHGSSPPDPELLVGVIGAERIRVGSGER